MDELKQRTTALDKLNDTVEWELFRPVLEKRPDYSGQGMGSLFRGGQLVATVG